MSNAPIPPTPRPGSHTGAAGRQTADSHTARVRRTLAEVPQGVPQPASMGPSFFRTEDRPGAKWFGGRGLGWWLRGVSEVEKNEAWRKA